VDKCEFIARVKTTMNINAYIYHSHKYSYRKFWK